MAITGPCYPLDHRLAPQITAGPQQSDRELAPNAPPDRVSTLPPRRSV